MAPEAWPLGHAAPDDDGPPHWPAPQRLVGYFQDGPNLVTLAMNGWADPERAWWRNLQAEPEATVELGGEARAVRARAAQAGSGRACGPRWSDIDRRLDAYAAKRSAPTAVVVLEPRPASP